uniref:protein eva-1 homolog C isoform X18 n=1 Tax=Callithrix jacchus TaxID=9483 RepID=UPI0023DD07C5|nr:protein eva-1 homolog C isoform X18 [Callithrix jacchus]
MLLPGPARPPPAPQPAQHPGLRRQVEPPGQLLRLFYCTVLVCSKEISALTDFSGYLTKLLQNHTAYACDGDYLNLQCPRHSTISVQSAFYGQDYQMCSSQKPASQREDSLTCVAPTTFQKVLDECQNQRACHLLVNSRVFGPDLCPGSSKYLLVSFKCQPSNFRSVFTYVDPKPTFEKRLPSAKECVTLSDELKNKTVCEDQELKLHCHESKFLNIYSATYGRRTQERDLCSSKAEWLPPFAHPERAALLFVSSVCIGLALTLCALVIRESCTKEVREMQLGREQLVPGSDRAEEDSEDEEEEEDSSDSDFPGELSGFHRTSYPVYSSIEAAELAERIERREQIIQEIWMNSGLDTSLPRNMGQFY